MHIKDFHSMKIHIHVLLHEHCFKSFHKCKIILSEYLIRALCIMSSMCVILHEYYWPVYHVNLLYIWIYLDVHVYVYHLFYCGWAETLKLLTAHHFKNRICHNDMKVIIKKKKKTLPMSSFLGEVGENFSLH